MGITYWISALRLRTLPLALSCIFMGGLLAARQHDFDWMIFSLCCLTTVALQILSNLANDYGDSIHGADSDIRMGPLRMVQSGNISSQQMKLGIGISGLIALALGLMLIYISLQLSMTSLLFLVFGIGALIAAVNYTMGKNPYGYVGLGDFSVFIFFGWLGVMGTYFLLTKTLDWSIMLPATSCSLFAVAVLNLNNIRDIESDQLVGKISIPVRIGREKAVIYHYALLIAGICCAIVYVLIHYKTPLQFLFLLTLPAFWLNAKAVSIQKEAMALDPYLKQMALTSLAFTLSFGVGQLLA